MQYAQVALKTKTQQIDQFFTYEIPPSILPQIKIGVLILVPFRNKNQEAIVVKLTRQKGGIFKLKKISKVLSEVSILEDWQIELAKAISSHYLAPLGETIFNFIPELSQKNHEFLTKNSPREVPLGIGTKRSKGAGKTYTFFHSHKQRINFILAVLKKYPDKKTLILFPNKILLLDFAVKIPFEFKNQTVVFSDDLNREEKFQSWLEIKSGEKNIILGTRKTILTPFIPEIIFITEPGHFGYKNEQEPRFNSFWIAQWFAKNYGSRLFILDEFPNTQIIYRLQKKEYQRLGSRLFGIQNSRLIKIIDRNKEKGVIGFETEQAITDTLAKKGRIIIYVNRRGYGSAVTCRDCGYKILCPRCEVPLITSYLASGSEILSCHYCNYQMKIPTRCPRCQGVNLIKTGLGTENFYYFFGKKFPQKKIILIDKNYKKTKLDIDFDILIATKKILEFPPFPVDLAVIINPDNSLAIPDYSANENVFIALRKLMNFGPAMSLSNGPKIFIETYNPNLEIFKQIQQDAREFFRQELLLRKNAGYPPFTVIVRLLVKNKKEKKAQELSVELFERVKKTIPEAVILGPSPCYLAKIRGYFRWQVILKVSPLKLAQILSKLKKIYSIGELSIDVDPANLL